MDPNLIKWNADPQFQQLAPEARFRALEGYVNQRVQKATERWQQSPEFAKLPDHVRDETVQNYIRHQAAQAAQVFPDFKMPGVEPAGATPAAPYGPESQRRREDARENKSAVGRALTRGFHTYVPGMVGGFTGLVGSIIESDSVKDWGFDLHQKSMQRAHENPANVEGIGGIKNPLDFATWAGESIVEFLPQMAMMLAGGKVALAGRALGGKAAVNRLLKGRIEKDAAKLAAAGMGKKQALATAQRRMQDTALTRLGAGLQVTAMYSGSNWAEVLERFGIDNPTSAIATGSLAGALTVIGGQTALIESVLGRKARDQFVQALNTGNRGLMSRIAMEFAKVAPKAAVEEFGQESLALMNAIYNDPEVSRKAADMFREYGKNIGRPLESAATVAVAAGLPGAVVRGGLGGQRSTTGDPDIKPDTTKAGERTPAKAPKDLDLAFEEDNAAFQSGATSADRQAAQQGEQQDIQQRQAMEQYARQVSQRKAENQAAEEAQAQEQQVQAQQAQVQQEQLKRQEMTQRFISSTETLPDTLRTTSQLLEMLEAQKGSSPFAKVVRQAHEALMADPAFDNPQSLDKIRKRVQDRSFNAKHPVEQVMLSRLDTYLGERIQQATAASEADMPRGKRAPGLLPSQADGRDMGRGLFQFGDPRSVPQASIEVARAEDSYLGSAKDVHDRKTSYDAGPIDPQAVQREIDRRPRPETTEERSEGALRRYLDRSTEKPVDMGTQKSPYPGAPKVIGEKPAPPAPPSKAAPAKLEKGKEPPKAKFTEAERSQTLQEARSAVAMARLKKYGKPKIETTPTKKGDVLDAGRTLAALPGKLTQDIKDFSPADTVQTNHVEKVILDRIKSSPDFNPAAKAALTLRVKDIFKDVRSRATSGERSLKTGKNPSPTGGTRGVRYQIESGVPVGKPYTTDSIREAFKGAEVKANPGKTWTVTLPNGETLTVKQVKHGDILVDKTKTGGREAKGVWLDADRIMGLTDRSDVETVNHEAFHAAWDIVLNANEKAQLKKKYGSEEGAADAYGKWRTKRDGSNPIFRMLFDLLDGIRKAFFPNQADVVFIRMKSGEVFIRNGSQVRDLGVSFEQDPIKWETVHDQVIFGTVNNRLSKELEVFEKLFGKTDKAQMLPGKLVDGVRENTRAIPAYDLGQELYRVINDPQFNDIFDPKVSPESAADKRKLTGKERADFITELQEFRSGPMTIEIDSNGKPVLSHNGKAGQSADFLLATCQPTTPCSNCYAATAYIRMSSVRKAFRNTVHILKDPDGWAARVAKEVAKVDKVKMPFVRMLGSGDLTFSEQIQGFNKLAELSDRPIHVFSRHHDNLAKLKDGKKGGTFTRMGSIDSQLFKHYGMEFLKNNFKERGITNAWLYEKEADIPLIKELHEANPNMLVLATSEDLHKKLPKNIREKSCPCDADERSYMTSCRQCALCKGGCFKSAAKVGKFDVFSDYTPSRAIPTSMKSQPPEAIGYAQAAMDLLKKGRELINLYINNNRNLQDYNTLLDHLIKHGLNDIDRKAIQKIREKYTLSKTEEQRLADLQSKKKEFDDADLELDPGDAIELRDLRNKSTPSGLDAKRYNALIERGKQIFNSKKVTKLTGGMQTNWKKKVSDLKAFEKLQGMGKTRLIPLKDLRFPGKITFTPDQETAQAFKDNLQQQIDAANEGTFYLPGGEIQFPVAYRNWEMMKSPDLISEADALNLAFGDKQSSEVIDTRGKAVNYQLPKTYRNLNFRETPEGLFSHLNHYVDVTKQWFSDTKGYLTDGRFTEAWVDDLQPVKEVSPEAWKTFKMSRGIGTIMGVVMRDGTLKYNHETNHITLGDRDGGIMKPFEGMDNKTFADVKARLLAERVDSLLKKGTLDQDILDRIYGDDADGSPIDSRQYTDELLRETAHLKGDAKYKEVKAHLEKYNLSMLDLLEASGIISKEKRDEWAAYGSYVPLNRILEKDTDHDVHKSQIWSQATKAQGPKKFKGSRGYQIGDPLDNLMANYTYLVNQAMINTGLKKLYNQAAPLGVLVKGKSPLKPTKGDYITIKVKGKDQYIRVEDARLFNALADMDAPAFNIKALTTAKRWLTWGVTVSPAFRIRNFLRDLGHTWILTGQTNLADVSKAFVDTWRRHPDLIELRATGGAFAGSYYSADNPQSIAKTIDTKRKQKKGKGIWEMWERLGEASENANRLALYRKLRKAGKSQFDAAFEAKDIVDFTAHGKSSLARFMISVVPFLNARIQGLHKVGREMQGENRRKVILRGAAVATASVLLHTLNAGSQDDDDRWYDQLTDHDKWLFWHFGKGFAVPKPFELGALFGALPVQVVDATYKTLAKGDDQAYKDLLRFTGFTLFNTLSINPLGQGSLLVEQLANKSFFTGNPIVPQYMGRMDPDMQWDHRTSKFARDLGSKLGLSPKRIDHLVEGTLSYAGMAATATYDAVLRPWSDYPPDPALTLSDYHWLHGRIPRGKSRYIKQEQEFYELFAKADRAMATYNKLKDIDASEARDYRKKHRGELVTHRHASRIRTQLSKIRDQERQIYENRRMSRDEKREALDKLVDRRHKIILRRLDRLKERIQD